MYNSNKSPHQQYFYPLPGTTAGANVQCPVYFCLSASHLRFPVTEDEISRSVARFVAGWLVVTISGQLVTNIVTSSTMDPPPLNPDPGKPKRLRLSASLESKFGPRVRPGAEAGREDRSASETRRGRRARTLSYEVKVSTKFCGTQYFRKASSPC